MLGLLSPGGVHSHEQQILALIRHAAQQGLSKVYLHAFLDGRDTPPRSAKESLQQAEDLFAELNCGQVVSVTGRYYAMIEIAAIDKNARITQSPVAKCRFMPQARWPHLRQLTRETKTMNLCSPQPSTMATKDLW